MTFRKLLVLVALVGVPAVSYAGFLDDLTNAVDQVAEDIDKAIQGDSQKPASEAQEEPAVADFDIATEDPMREPRVTGDNIEDEELWGHLWGDVRLQWGQNFSHDSVIVHHKDVTCDGRKDYVASHLNLDNPDGYFYNILIAARDGEEIRTEHVSLPFTGSSEQYGLCMMEDKPFAEVYYDVWPPEEIEEFIGMNVCPTAIEVVDGMCDTPRFFWSNEAKPDEPHLVFFRH